MDVGGNEKRGMLGVCEGVVMDTVPQVYIVVKIAKSGNISDCIAAYSSFDLACEHLDRLAKKSKLITHTIEAVDLVA